MIINKIHSEILNITAKLIGEGLAIQQNYPVTKNSTVTWSQEESISLALRNVSYLDKYRILEEASNYNVKLLDGALIQMQYAFSKQGGKLRSHRLAYFPSPKLERYEEVPEEYEKKYFGDSEFHDIFDSNVITFPIRFDFDNDSKKFKSVDHPYCHVHFGEFETCRIPVAAPISPAEFMNFILRNFYKIAVRDYCNSLSFKIKNRFDETIDDHERKVMHIYCK